MNEFAKIVNGQVVQVIVSSQQNVNSRSDGPWILTSYNGSTGKVGIGYSYSAGAFHPPAAIEYTYFSKKH